MATPIDRRKFLGGMLTVGAAGLVRSPLSLPYTRPRDVAQKPAAKAASAGAGEHTLVLVTLYGGNDGLNTVIPLEDPAYLSQRDGLGIAPEKTLSLGNGYGLNPAMPGFKAAWDAGQLAIVRGVGYPNPNRSHFQSMDIWQSGSVSSDEGSGWLGRWLDRAGKEVLEACSIGPTVLPAMAGAHRQAAALQDSTSPSSQLPDVDGHLLALYRDIHRPAAGDSPLDRSVADAGADMLNVSRTAAKAMRTERAPVYPLDVGDLGTQLGVVSQLIRAGVPTSAFAVTQGGYDTHAGELTTQSGLLSQLDGAVTGFLSSIASTPRGRNTTVVIYTEFGRRVEGNGSGGSDHGTANNVYALGPPVHGGLYGDEPSLTRLDDNGNLLHTVDYRSVYATVLEGVLGAESKPVLHHSYPLLGFV